MNFILYGQEYPIMKKQLNKLLASRLDSIDELSVFRFDFQNDDINEIFNEATSFPFYVARKAVIIDNASFLQKGAKKEVVDNFFNTVKNGVDQIDLYFLLRSDEIDEKNPIFDFIKNNGQIFVALALTPAQWPKYAKKYFMSQNCEIDNDALEELLKRIDNDLSRFINEADKLILYKNHIDIIDVNTMVSPTLEDDVFHIANALLQGENSLALASYRDLRLTSPKDVDRLIPLFASQFRFAEQVLFLSKQGLSNNEIATELNVKPFRVGKTLSNKKHLSLKRVYLALDNLFMLDWQIKSGQIDRYYGIELFLINF